MSPLSLTKEVQKRFEVKYRHNDIPWLRGDVPTLTKDLAEKIKKEYNHPTLLDVGCGNGWVSLYFAKRGIEVWGVDSSETAIKMAEESAQQQNIINTHFSVGDALDFPYEDQQFDAVYDRGLLHHQPESEWPRYLAGLKRVLKPSGYFYLEVFGMDSMKKGFSPKVDGRTSHTVLDATGYRTHDHFFDRQTVENFLGTAFNLIKGEKDATPSSDGAILLRFLMQKNGK